MIYNTPTSKSQDKSFQSEQTKQAHFPLYAVILHYPFALTFFLQFNKLLRQQEIKFQYWFIYI